ncbi:MAG: hypothetical protein V4508_02225 [Pseudomonadota bacterium]
MRTPNNSSARYQQGDPPADPAMLQTFLREELTKIGGALAALAVGHLDVLTVAPVKPREVDLHVADGVLWNPGGGKGLYAYSGGAWTLIKALP